MALVLVQTFHRYGVLIWFKINQERIAKTLCINRARPELHCDGQCVLMQKLSASEEAPADAPALPASKPKSESALLPETAGMSPLLGARRIGSCFPEKREEPTGGFTSSIFRPPIA